MLEADRKGCDSVEPKVAVSAEEVKQVLSRFLGGTAPGIQVEVKNGTVVLLGQVERLAEKMVAEDLISRLAGVQQVENGLLVQCADECDDVDIEVVVKQRLRARGNLQAVGAEVRGGVVYLEGQVAMARDEEQARRLVALVRGVTEVVSQLEATHEETDDFDLVHRAADTVSQDGRIHSEGMLLEASEGEIHLKGWIPSQEMKDAARERVEAVPGVRQVHNHLVVEEEQDERDAYLTHILHQVMEQHPDPGLGGVRALVVRGVAHLYGEVNSVDTKENLEEIVSQVSENFDGLDEYDDDVDIRIH